MIKVSVIIPIFGVDKFIERCAVSLFEQSLQEMEFIFVNDCTKDKSMQVLQKVIEHYPDRKEHIHIVNHTENRGLPSARKTGMQYVHGEYVAHCDSDDWVEKNMYETLYLEANKNNLDIVWCDYFRGTEQSKIFVSTENQPALMQGPVWNKLVRTTLYQNSDFVYPTANKGEDGVIMTQLSFYAQKRGHIKKAYYNYFINPDSICGVVTPEGCLEKLNQEAANVKIKEDFLIRNGVAKKYKDNILRWKILTRKNLLPILDKKDYFSIWKQTFPEVDMEYLKSSKINIRHKIAYLLIRLHLYRICGVLVQKWS